MAEDRKFALERRARFLGSPRLRQESPDWLQRPSAVASLAGFLDGAELQQVESVGFLPGLLQSGVGSEFSEVEERAGDRGDRNWPLGRSVLVIDAPPMEPY